MLRAERRARHRSKLAQRRLELALLKHDRLKSTLMGKRTTFTWAGEIRSDRTVRGMCKQLVRLGMVSRRRIATKNLSAGDEALLDRALYETRLFLATKEEVFRRTEYLRQSMVRHLTYREVGERTFPAKYRLNELQPEHLTELLAIRQLVESNAIRWPVMLRSSPLYPRDIIEEMRAKVLKKEENRRQGLGEREARMLSAALHTQSIQGIEKITTTTTTTTIPSTPAATDLGKGKTKAQVI